MESAPISLRRVRYAAWPVCTSRACFLPRFRRTASMIVVRWQGFVATAFSLAVVQSYAAGGQLPKEVASHVADMNEQCESYGGKPGQSGTWEPFEGKSKFHAQSLVEHSTLARGRVEVWVIDEGRYQCSKAASLFSGSGGAQVYVFARLKDGSVKQVLMLGA